ncbi:MAG: hypothetical protein LBD43_02995, partial [Holosporales bacterium]|nr:hypothetical protein [Holosporales bacterium]
MSRRRIATLTVVSILMATVRMEAKAGEGNTPTRDGGQTLRLWQDDTATQETKNTYVDACVNMKAYEMLGVNPQGADPGEFREWSHDSRPGLSPYKDKRGVIIVGGKGEAAAGEGRSPLTGTRRVQTRTTAVEPEVPWRQGGTAQALQTAEAQQWPPQAEEAQLASTGAPELQGSTARAPRTGGGRSPLTETRRVQTRTTAVEPEVPGLWDGAVQATRTAEAQQWP